MITNAISKKPWSGEAVVNVSIVNWVKQPAALPAVRNLDGEVVGEISASLSPVEIDVSDAMRLAQNGARSFQGPIPAGEGFVLSPEEAQDLLQRSEAEYGLVIRPYLIGDDITDDPGQDPRRWIIDFAKKPLEEAMSYPAALEIVRMRVKPDRDVANREPQQDVLVAV